MESAEKYVDLNEAARMLPNKPAPAAVWRWARKGIKTRAGGRVYLRHYRFGGKLYTTAKDLAEFAEELARRDAEHFREDKSENCESNKSVGPDAKGIPPRTDEQRKHAIAAARRVLAEKA